MSKIYQRKCDNCGNDYAGKGKFYCSKTCQTEWMRKNTEKHPSFKGGKIEKNCETCNKIFFVWPNGKSAKFCSRTCKKPTKESIEAAVKTRKIRMDAGLISRGGQKKGYKPSQEAIEKQRAAMKGKIPKNLLALHAAKRLKGPKPKPHCIDCGVQKTTHGGLRCRSCSQAGERNCAWEGGVTEINRTVRSSLRYKKWRKAVLLRDNQACRGCGITGVDMDVDHVYPLSTLIKDHGIATLPEAYKTKEFWDVENGRTLCKLCHDQTETSQRLYFKKVC